MTKLDKGIPSGFDGAAPSRMLRECSMFGIHVSCPTSPLPGSSFVHEIRPASDQWNGRQRVQQLVVVNP